MNQSFLYLLLIVMLAIFVPVILSFIRAWDFKRQIQGKHPERKLKGNEKISYDKPQTPNGELDSIKTAGITNTRTNGQMNRWLNR